MISTTTYSQRDPRWANIYLGFSRLKIGGYGCTITCITNLVNSLGYTETPATVNAKLKSVNGFSGALVIWGAVQKIWTKLRFVERGTQYNNIKVSWYVYGKQMPVIVKVYAPQIGAINHWVLFIGDRKMIDPWTGKIVPTSTYKPVAYSLYDRVN